ncbi:MAG: hypothetical protein ACOC58_02525 [Chloroflexota bacterium]
MRRASWHEADDKGKCKLLKTAFVYSMVDEGKITDVELHPPYNFIMRWKRDEAEVGVSKEVHP